MTAGVRDRRWVSLLIAVLVIVIDRVTKLTVKAHVPMGHHIAVIPGVFWISHVLNTGAAFSMFEGARNPNTVRVMLMVFSLVAVVAVIVALWRMGRTITLTAVSLALILGGAVGNLYDRWMYRHVIDFLEVHIGSYHWPDFNAADSAIVVGACLLFVEVLRPQRTS